MVGPRYKFRANSPQLRAKQGKNLVVLWENPKTEQKHFFIKPVWKEKYQAVQCTRVFGQRSSMYKMQKVAPIKSVFRESALDVKMQMLWKLLFSYQHLQVSRAFKCSSLRGSKLFSENFKTFHNLEIFGVEASKLPIPKQVLILHSSSAANLPRAFHKF